MLLYFGCRRLVVLVVLQDYLVGNDNQPDGVTCVSCRCRPFLLNHRALLILTIVHYCYSIILLYFDWCDLVVLVVFQVDLVGNVNQPDGVIYVSCRCRPFLLNHRALLILTIVHYCYKIMLL
jgi:hypothetical protein